MKNNKKTTATIIIAIIVAVVTLIIFIKPTAYLVLRNDKTGEVFAEYPLKDGQGFSVEFIHSVNKSPVIDKYKIVNGEIYVVETVYYQFGAGVQTEILDGQTLSYGEDGSMIISNIDIKIPYLSYMVGTWSDHILEINQQKISLRDTCGRSAIVHFSYERKSAFSF